MKFETINEFQKELNKLGLSPNEYFMLYAIVEDKDYPKGVNVELHKGLLWKKGWLTPKWQPTDKVAEAFGERDPDYDRRIEEYKIMFPTGVLPNGKKARSDTRELKIRFKWFFENYDYSWDTVIKATQEYIQYYAMNNFMFMRTSSYFIYKQETPGLRTSDLADWCDKALSNEPETGFDINL